MPETKQIKKIKTFENSDDFGEFRTVFFVLQIFGLAPYVIGEDFEHSRPSKYLIIYNYFIASLVMVNLYHSQNDPLNDLEYPNKTLLINVAYHFVDFLGNLYIFFVTIKSTIHTDIAMIVWFKLKSINAKLRSDFNVVFDLRKMKYYMFFKMILLATISASFIAAEIVIHIIMELYYTPSYWVSRLFPLLYSVVIGIIFGSCTLCLYQRLWAINAFLKKFIREYPPKRKPDLRFYNEKILEELIFETRDLYRVNKIKIHPEAPKLKKMPLLVMVKNYEECFGKKEHPDLLKCIKQLKEIYFQLFELTNDLNILFGTHFLFIFVSYFFGITINLYFAITFHLRAFESEQYASACLWAIVYLFLIIYLVTFSNIASNESHHTTELIHKFLSKINYDDYNLQLELHSFAMKLLQCPIRFKAQGFFSLDSALLFRFIAGVLSNLVLVVQFDKINFST